jgi:hypothetical protein
MKKVTNELCFRLIKMLDICYIAVISILAGLGLAIFSDRIFGKFDEEKFNQEKNKKYFKIKLIFRLFLLASYTGVILYITRNLMEKIPSPFHGICNFDHYRVGEIRSMPAIIFLLFFYYQKNLYGYISNIFKGVI